MTVSLHHRFITLAVLVLALVPAVRAQPLAAPNVVPINRNLVTSGQPTVEGLSNLGQHGFKAVIYLAPSSVSDAVAAEPTILAEQGIEFVHIPVPFGAPTEGHLQALSAALQRQHGRKVLVHCQVNMRASTLVFLHRAIVGQENPTLAWEAVTRVWVPQGPWKTLVVNELAKHNIKFEPF